MASLEDSDLFGALTRRVVDDGVPFLGICIGLQVLFERSEEGPAECLGWLPGAVRRFPDTDRVPQIGWNNIYDLQSPLFMDVRENTFMYFVHSYYAERGANTIALTNYGVEYSSAIQKDNFFAVQFHPEKSGDAGEKILKNFIEL